VQGRTNIAVQDASEFGVAVHENIQYSHGLSVLSRPPITYRVIARSTDEFRIKHSQLYWQVRVQMRVLKVLRWLSERCSIRAIMKWFTISGRTVFSHGLCKIPLCSLYSTVCRLLTGVSVVFIVWWCEAGRCGAELCGQCIL